MKSFFNETMLHLAFFAGPDRRTKTEKRVDAAKNVLINVVVGGIVLSVTVVPWCLGMRDMIGAVWRRL